MPESLCSPCLHRGLCESPAWPGPRSRELPRATEVRACAAWHRRPPSPATVVRSREGSPGFFDSLASGAGAPRPASCGRGGETARCAGPLLARILGQGPVLRRACVVPGLTGDDADGPSRPGRHAALPDGAVRKPAFEDACIRLGGRKRRGARQGGGWRGRRRSRPRPTSAPARSRRAACC